MKRLNRYRTIVFVPAWRQRSACWLVRAVLVLAAMACACSGRSATAVQEPEPPAAPLLRVVVVSVDGLMPITYLEPELHGMRTPMLRQMRANGAYSPGMRTVMPSVTYPAHTSMVTGVLPSVHGIVSNKTPDPLRRNMNGWYWYAEDIRVPTLWEIARENGMSTALVGWPVTVGADSPSLVPEFWRAGTLDDVKLVRALSSPGLLDAVAKRFPDFWQRFTIPDVEDSAIMDIAVHHIETDMPRLMLIHTWMVDEFQHRTGPWADEAKAKIEEVDRQLARLVAALERAGAWDDTILVVLSDHGFMAKNTYVAPGVIMANLGLVTVENGKVIQAKAHLDSNDGQAYIYVADEKDYTTKELLVRTFTELASQPDSGIELVLRRKEIRERGGDEQAFLALYAAPGFALRSEYTGAARTTGGRRGAHGYDETLPEMNASLLIYGPRVEPGVIEGGHVIDIAPTIAQWLGISMPDDIQGKPLAVSVAARPKLKEDSGESAPLR